MASSASATSAHPAGAARQSHLIRKCPLRGSDDRTRKAIELYTNHVSRPDSGATAHDAHAGQLRLRHPELEASTHLEGKRQLQRHTSGRDISTGPLVGLLKTNAVPPGDQNWAAHKSSLVKSRWPNSSHREGHRADGERDAAEDHQNDQKLLFQSQLRKRRVQDLPERAHIRPPIISEPTHGGVWLLPPGLLGPLIENDSSTTARQTAQ